MPTVEIPHATDREGRRLWAAYERRKTVELALKISNEHRLSKSELPLDEWMAQQHIPPHRLWGVEEQEEVTDGE